MHPGKPANDAPLPPFLVGGAPSSRPGGAAQPPATSAAGGPGTPGTPGTPAAAHGDRPAHHVLSLPFTGPRGEAALTALPVTALSRRRVGWLVVAAAAVWILLLFVRQVGDASAAQARADQIRRENEALAAEVRALEAERALVERSAFVALEARGHGLGAARERAFSLAPGAPTLAPDAPGSARLRVGHQESSQTPLESWLELLFGPAP